MSQETTRTNRPCAGCGTPTEWERDQQPRIHRLLLMPQKHIELDTKTGVPNGVPPVEDYKYFCSFACLKQWVNQQG